MTTEEMENRLREAYPESTVAVVDLTGGGSNFEIRISEPSFENLPRVKQHQAVMKVFSDELASGEVHALAIKTLNL